MEIKKSLTTLFAVVYCVLAFSSQPLVRNFTRKDYKSGTQNWSIAQDENNTMYFANNNGLLTYDGRNWITAPNNNGTNVYSMLPLNDGQILTTSFGEFGYFKKNKFEKLTYTSLIKSASVSKHLPSGVYRLLKGKNTIYLYNSKSIFEFTNKKLIKYPFRGRIDYANIVNEKLYITDSRKGVFLFEKKTFLYINGSELLQNKKVCTILPLNDTNTLFVTALDGVYRFDGNKFISLNTKVDYFLKSYQTTCAAIHQNQLVFGTLQRGIAILNIENDSVTYINTFSGLQNNSILSLYFDTQQNLWLGLDKGIDYVILNSPITKILGNKNYNGVYTNSAFYNKLFYLGTSLGLYSINYPLNTNFSIPDFKLHTTVKGQINCMQSVDKMLFCGSNQGLYIIEKNSTQCLLQPLQVYYFKELKAHKDVVLGCSDKGLFLVRKLNNKWKFSGFIKGNFTERCSTFEEDKDGTIWLNQPQKGLYHLDISFSNDSITKTELYNKNAGFDENTNNKISIIGNEIIFSLKSGLCKFNKNKQIIEPDTFWSNRFKMNPAFMSFYQASESQVWCMTANFLGLATRESATTYTIDSTSYKLIQTNLISGSEHINFLNKHNVVVCTEDELYLIDTHKKTVNFDQFKIYFKKILVANENEELSNVDLNNKKSFNTSFEHNQNRIIFEFIAPEYRKDNVVKYSYKLQNHDNTWSEFSNNNTKEYIQLKRGNYTFIVRAKNELEQQEAICSYSFSILPAWYETTSAIILYILFGIIVLTGLFLHVKKQSKNGELKMEKIKKQELIEQKKYFEREVFQKTQVINELKNEQLQEQLRLKTQELASSTLNLVHKNETLLEIAENISMVNTDIKKSNNSNNILSKLKKMEEYIKQNIERDNNWKQFEENFDLVYEGYLKRLNEVYPKLNINERRLCAYLRMNLSTKDICMLMNVPLRSIEMHRYRLRKKMNLTRDTNLSEFLQKF